MSTWVTPITWVNGGLTASAMNVGIRDKMNYLKAALDQAGILGDTAKPVLTPALMGARANRTAAQTITSGTTTVLAFDTERFDAATPFHDTVTNNSRLTVPAASGGYYLVGAHITWQGNATGYRRLFLRVNGTGSIIGTQNAMPSGTEAVSLTVVSLFQLAAADYVEASVLQNSGVSLTVQGGVDADGAEFWIHRLAAT